MKSDHAHLTDAEWRIMLRLWEKSPQTMMELTRSLETETGWSKHTVITMLKRMAVKGTVQICEDGPVKTYAPAIDKAWVAREQIQTLLRRLFDGRAFLLMSELAREGGLTPEEIAQMQLLLGCPKNQKKTKSRKPFDVFSRPNDR